MDCTDAIQLKLQMTSLSVSNRLLPVNTSDRHQATWIVYCCYCSSSSRDHTGDIDPQWRNMDCCI